MAEETKPVVAEAAVPEVAPVVAAPAAEVPAAETKPAEEAAPAVVEPAPEAAPAVTATETPADAEAPAAAEDAKDEEEAKPVEEGPLSHKGEGANFPKNLIYNKKLFWFSSDPVELKGFRADKVTDIANHLTAWAAETGKGLLFFSDKNDKTAITGLIPLSEASEPVAEGPHKFQLTAKGHKHVFKAATPAERDNWVTQIKAKIAEAKDIAINIQESETYKKTLDALKPAVPKKDEKAADPAAETAEADAAVAPVTEETAEAPAEAATEAAKESTAEEPTEESKPGVAKGSEKRSVSANRKRASLFGLLGGKKEKAPETPAAETPAAEAQPTEAAAEAPAAPEAPAEAPVDASETAEVVTEPTEGKVEEKKKPVPTKRSSIFGNLGNLPFGKKRGEPVTIPATEESAVATDAPVIPAMATTEPLSTDAPAETAAEAPAEAADATAETAVEAKPSESAPKLEKRKSSRPFGFGKKKTETSDDEVESPKLSPFSKFRATIKGNKGKHEKVPETEEAPAVPEVPAEAAEAAPADGVEPAAEPSAAPAEAASEGAPPASQVVTAAA